MNKAFRDLIPWTRDRKVASRTVANIDDNPFLALQRDLNRVFDSFWSESGMLAPFGESFSALMPRTDMTETDSAVDITVELPGIHEKDLEVLISPDELIIRGEKKAEHKEEKKDRHLSERSYGWVERHIALPDGVDADKAETRFKDGVLSVRLPKTAEAQKNVRRIEIKAA